MTNPDPTGLLGSMLAGGIVLLIVYLLLSAGMIALGVWLTYTLIWKAVRRGLYEYHNPGHTKASRDLENRVRGPRDW